jgi:hypothetical protein
MLKAGADSTDQPRIAQRPRRNRASAQNLTEVSVVASGDGFQP